jgi:hypothetical protein
VQSTYFTMENAMNDPEPTDLLTIRVHFRAHEQSLNTASAPETGISIIELPADSVAALRADWEALSTSRSTSTPRVYMGFFRSHDAAPYRPRVLLLRLEDVLFID